MKTIKTMLSVGAILSALLVPLMGWASEADDLDAEVRRLCAIDGGIKVYETVALPADQFDSKGHVRIRGDKILAGSGYTLQFHQHYYKKGNVPVGRTSSMLQFRTALIRNSDGKLIGESLIYERAGGGVLDRLADSPSHFECPPILETDSYALAKRVFVPLTESGQASHGIP